MADSRRAIVVIHPGGLGDVLLSLDALVALRTRAPRAEIILLAAPEVGTLLACCGVIDRIVPIESGLLGALFSGIEEVSDVDQEVLYRCDLVVGWLSDPTGSLKRTIQEFGIPQVILHSPAVAEGGHQSERFLQTLPKEFHSGTSVPARLRLPEQLREAGVGALRDIGVNFSAPLIVCHPSSGSSHKCVQADTWRVLIRGCQDRRLMPIVVLGPADEQAAVALQQWGISDLPILRPQTVTLLAAILAQSQGYIGHDSGVTHLAALLEVPTVVMFGPTDPQRWAPRGAHVTVVRGGICSCSGWEMVRDCAEKPCLNVAASDVLQAIDTMHFRYHQVTNS